MDLRCCLTQWTQSLEGFSNALRQHLVCYVDPRDVLLQQEFRHSRQLRAVLEEQLKSPMFKALYISMSLWRRAHRLASRVCTCVNERPPNTLLTEVTRVVAINRMQYKLAGWCAVIPIPGPRGRGQPIKRDAASANVDAGNVHLVA